VGDDAVAHRATVGPGAGQPTRTERRAEKAGDDPARRAPLEPTQVVRHLHAVLIGGQLRRDLRVDDRPAEDVDEVEKRQEESRQHRRRVQLDDRLPGHRRVDDQHDRRRDQDAQGPARGDRARGELHVVAGVQHRPHRDDAHQHDDGADDARGDAPERAHEQGRDGQRGGHAPERELDAVEHAVDERGPLHDVAHEDEQRDRQQGVVRHHAVGPLHDQVEDPVVVPVGAGHPEGDVAEDHPEPHQGEGGREAHHDRHHDEAEHRQAERGIAHGVRLCRSVSSITLR
jgi:hypothetical protein